MNAEPPTVTDTKGVVHVTVCYPFANTVGCSCGWVRRDVADTIMDELCNQHLTHQVRNR